MLLIYHGFHDCVFQHENKVIFSVNPDNTRGFVIQSFLKNVDFLPEDKKNQEDWAS